MKRKQKALKRILKQKSYIQRILNMLSIDEVSQYFINKIDHEEGLQQVDPELLEIVMQKLIAKDKENDQKKPSDVKVDVLTLGEPELIAFCRQKGLITLYQYLGAIRYKKYNPHSYYGYMLVNNFPKQFEIGKRCTHYHCKTTAKNIEKEYGIFNTYDDQDQSKEVDSRHQSDEEFVVDDGIDVSEEIVMKKRSRKKKEKQNQESKDGEQDEKASSSSLKKKKKNKMKNALNSESEDEKEEIKKGKKGINPKQKMRKMKMNQQQQNKKQDQFLYQALQSLKAVDILQNLDYPTMFQFLSEKEISKLLPILDQISETVLFNKEKIKRQKKKKALKQKNHKKHLSKSKINLKELSLQDLLIQCQKHGIIKSEDLEVWDTKYEIFDHPKLAHKLISKKPTAYVIQGQYDGTTEKDINTAIEDAYRQYANLQQNSQQNEESDFINDQEQSQQVSSQESDSDDDYSIGSQEQKLGELQ